LYPSLRTARAEALFAKIQPIIMNKLSNAVDPNRALLSFDKFLFLLPAGVQLFSLFNTNRHLIDLFIDIISSSDVLSEYLSNNVQVLDAVIGGAFWREWPGLDLLREDLAILLRRETDYESQLNASRRWGREWHFRIGVHLLRGVITPEEAGTQYGDLALAMLKELWCLVNTQFAKKYGPAPGRGSALIGLGSLGIKKLHSQSDLDLILIYDAAGVEMSSGEKSIASRSYYARLTKALVAAISAPMNEKSLFHVDMRLRPSGNQGPVATSLQAFKHYQTSEAWVWEHLALVNATIVAGPEILRTDISKFCESLKKMRSEKNVMAGLSIMRNRLFSPSNINKKWSMKLGQGKLQDIELVSQMGIILINEGVSGVHNGLIALLKLKKICADDLAYLIKTYDLLLGVQILSKLLLKDDIKDGELGVNGKDLFLKYTDTLSVPLLVEKISEMAFNSSVIIDNILPNSKEVHDER
jgi:glutamate-ammonia-ligase adenylyltransferase